MADALYFVGKTAWYVWYAHKRFPLRASRMVGLGLVVFLRLLLLAMPLLLLLLLKLLLALLEALLLACWCGVVVVVSPGVSSDAWRATWRRFWRGPGERDICRYQPREGREGLEEIKRRDWVHPEISGSERRRDRVA